jgi:hypothetical protein
MLMRPSIFVAGLLATGLSASVAAAQTLSVDAARRFVLGKLFSYTCYDGSRGTGRIYDDGSAIGTIQVRGSGPVRYASLPPGTLHVKGQAVCATLRGMSVEPCFNLNKTDAQSFRGSVWGLGILYCDFTRRPDPTVRTTWRVRPPPPVSLDASAAGTAAAPAVGPSASAAEAHASE